MRSLEGDFTGHVETNVRGQVYKGVVDVTRCEVVGSQATIFVGLFLAKR